MTQLDSSTTVCYAGIFRRLFAIFYDCLLLLALLFIDSAIFTAVNGGNAITADNPLHIIYVMSLSGVSFLYFGWFWTHGGQTLGMQSWHIKLQAQTGGNISWKQALIRYLTAILSWCCLATGFIWSVFSSNKQCWHDISSHSVILDVRE